MELSERYGYADDIESIVDTKDSADGLGVEMTTSVVLERLNQLEAAIAKYEKYIDIKELDKLLTENEALRNRLLNVRGTILNATTIQI